MRDRRYRARPRVRASGVAEPKVIVRPIKTSPEDIIMRNINLRYVDEAYDENGLLTKFDITMPDNFNFAYDVVDDIAINDPERTAMVWCNPEGEEHTFTFADMKTWSDKTANFLADCGIGRGDFVIDRKSTRLNSSHT